MRKQKVSIKKNFKGSDNVNFELDARNQWDAVGHNSFLWMIKFVTTALGSCDDIDLLACCRAVLCFSASSNS